ncbi:MAG: hypothetical protein QOI10_2992 [Solirubrobacterales bacterium]|jgi:hypothetical protein|nr:hypothetical protein [Solirubrobacterales bacterium]
MSDRPLPPGKVPLRRNGSWRKQWRYLGAFCDELLLCAARVQVGPVGQTFWAIWDREQGRLHERTRMIPPLLARGEVWTELAEGEHTGRVDWAPDKGGTLVRIEAAPKGSEDEQIRAFLRAGEGTWAQAVCETGEDDGYVWTRKRPVAVECDVRFGERRIRCQARGVEDESCGYHPHHTVWDWSAGIGEATDGRAVAWNLVSGINDPPRGSERAIWVDGEPTEPGPATFDGLEAIEVDGARLEFSAEAERSREESKPWAKYAYRQPFGTFAGALPGGIELARGFGVMEHHDAHW